ncbi:hypothetical protein [Lactovum odontotermitis]
MAFKYMEGGRSSSGSDVDEWFIEMMKENERASISAYLTGERTKINAAKSKLEGNLNELEEEMKQHLNTVASNLKPGLEGKTSDQAQNYLTSTMSKPNFSNPVKGA